MRTRRLTVNDSGVKHSKINKMYLKMQRSYLHSMPPALVVLPIMSLEDIKGWDGVDPHEALVLRLWKSERSNRRSACAPECARILFGAGFDNSFIGSANVS